MNQPAEVEHDPTAPYNVGESDLDDILGALVDMAADECADIPNPVPARPAADPPARRRGATQAPPAEIAVSAPPTPAHRPHFLVGDAPELAEALARDLQGNSPVAAVHDEGEFWRYDPSDGAYKPISDDEAVGMVSRYSRMPVGTGPHPRPLSLSVRAIRDALELCASKLRVAAPEFFKHAMPGMAFRNVFVGLKDNRVVVRAHSPAHRARHPLPFDYDEGTTCPRWQRYLVEVFPPVVPEEEDTPPIEDGAQRAALMQEFCGASLFGLAPRFALALVFEGGGDNGKSV